MPITRRDFTGTMSLAVLAAATPRTLYGFARRLASRDEVFEWSPLGVPEAHLCGGHGGNAMVVRSGDEALLVDCKNAGFGHALRSESEALGAPLRWIVNTHHHADHSGGNYAFSDGERLLAHRAARDRILAQHDRYVQALRGLAGRSDGDDESARLAAEAAPEGFLAAVDRTEPGAWAPTVLMDGEREIRIGETVVELRHVGPGHTDNDVFVYLPERNLLHAGDLVFHDLHPFIDRPAGAETPGWIRSCRAMLGLCDASTVVVPGHGEVGGREILQGQIDYFGRTVDEVRAAIDRGLDREAVTALAPDHFRGMGFEQLAPRVLGAVYDELTGAPAD